MPYRCVDSHCCVGYSESDLALVTSAFRTLREPVCGLMSRSAKCRGDSVESGIQGARFISSHAGDLLQVFGLLGHPEGKGRSQPVCERWRALESRWLRSFCQQAAALVPSVYDKSLLSW